MGKQNQEHKYYMNEKEGTIELETTDIEKDLEVNIDRDLKFSKHVEIQCNKANTILGLIRKSYDYLYANTLKTLFIALVRPHLE